MMIGIRLFTNRAPGTADRAFRGDLHVAGLVRAAIAAGNYAAWRCPDRMGAGPRRSSELWLSGRRRLIAFVAGGFAFDRVPASACRCRDHGWRRVGCVGMLGGEALKDIGGLWERTAKPVGRPGEVGKSPRGDWPGGGERWRVTTQAAGVGQRSGRGMRGLKLKAARHRKNPKEVLQNIFNLAWQRPVPPVAGADPVSQRDHSARVRESVVFTRPFLESKGGWCSHTG